MRDNRNEAADDDLRPEYTEQELGKGMRGKYLRQYRAGTNVVVLAPDATEAFPTAESVNEALRLLMKVAATTSQHSHKSH